MVSRSGCYTRVAYNLNGGVSLMAKPNVWVTGKDGQFRVTSEGADRAASVHRTQRDAIEAGREIAQSRRAELFIHGENGRIRDRETYGNDPCPPKDKR
jgi:hypothetical protein